jgi:hypothetical protein
MSSEIVVQRPDPAGPSTPPPPSAPQELPEWLVPRMRDPDHLLQRAVVLQVLRVRSTPATCANLDRFGEGGISQHVEPPLDFFSCFTSASQDMCIELILRGEGPLVDEWTLLVAFRLQHSTLPPHGSRWPRFSWLLRQGIFEQIDYSLLDRCPGYLDLVQRVSQPKPHCVAFGWCETRSMCVRWIREATSLHTEAPAWLRGFLDRGRLYKTSAVGAIEFGWDRPQGSYHLLTILQDLLQHSGEGRAMRRFVGNCMWYQFKAYRRGLRMSLPRRILSNTSLCSDVMGIVTAYTLQE